MKRRVPNLFSKAPKVYPYQNFTEDRFKDIPVWHVEEFVDGPIIRVIADLKRETLSYRGEEEETHIDPAILATLMGMITIKKLKKLIKLTASQPQLVNMFIRVPTIKDELYYVLVDMHVAGRWLTGNDIRVMAAKLNMQAAGYLGHHTTSNLLEYLATKPQSFLRNLIVRKVVCRDVAIGSDIIVKFTFKEQK